MFKATLLASTLALCGNQLAAQKFDLNNLVINPTARSKAKPLFEPAKRITVADIANAAREAKLNVLKRDKSSVWFYYTISTFDAETKKSGVKRTPVRIVLSTGRKHYFVQMFYNLVGSNPTVKQLKTLLVANADGMHQVAVREKDNVVVLWERRAAKDLSGPAISTSLMFGMMKAEQLRRKLR